MINLENVTYRNILNNINLKIHQGSIVTITGDNGSGKTTLLRAMLGLIKPDFGNVLYDDMLFESNRLKILKSIGSLIEAPPLYKHLTLEENLLYFSILSGICKERVQILINQFELSTYKKVKVSNLSLGTKQKLGLAISLVNNPQIIIWDEPTNSLDKSSISMLIEIIEFIHKNSTTIIVSTHSFDEILPISNQIIQMENGTILI